MRFHYNWAKSFSRIAANAIVNPSSSNKPSSANSYLTNKAIRTVRHHHFKLWK
jgi:hypothetical protein